MTWKNLNLCWFSRQIIILTCHLIASVCIALLVRAAEYLLAILFPLVEHVCSCSLLEHVLRGLAPGGVSDVPGTSLYHLYGTTGQPLLHSALSQEAWCGCGCGCAGGGRGGEGGAALSPRPHLGVSGRAVTELAEPIAVCASHSTESAAGDHMNCTAHCLFATPMLTIFQYRWRYC